jgi:hypothetical protein
MKKRSRRRAQPLPLIMAELTFDAWETILRRFWMMAEGSCSVAEYQSMVLEKALAAQRSASAMMLPRRNGHLRAALMPWHKGARANVRRLRKR